MSDVLNAEARHNERREQELISQGRCPYCGWRTVVSGRGQVCGSCVRDAVAARLTAAEALTEQLRAERDEWITEAGLRGLPKELMQRLHAAEAAVRAGGCAADLAESWELSAERALARRLPEGDMVAERGKAAVFRTCARELRESVAVSGLTAEKEEA